jgi:hypothetical protein
MQQQSGADDFDGFEFAVESTPKARESGGKTSDSSDQSTYHILVCLFVCDLVNIDL